MKNNFFFMEYKICQMSKLPFVTFIFQTIGFGQGLGYFGDCVFFKYHTNDILLILNNLLRIYNPISKKSDQNN